jgi:hypothetical protein
MMNTRSIKLLTVMMLMILSTVSCITTNPGYSPQFSDHFSNAEYVDNYLIFDKGDTITIPEIIEWNKKYSFTDDQGNKLTVKRITYTDIVFQIKTANRTIKGNGVLPPTFYNDFGFTEIDDHRLHFVTYVSEESSEKCIWKIRIGHDENDPEETLYAYIALALNCDPVKFPGSEKLLKVQK